MRWVALHARSYQWRRGGPACRADVAGPRAWGSLQKQWQAQMDAVLQAATLVAPKDSAFISTEAWRHSEHMGYILTEMQHPQRAYPGGVCDERRSVPCYIAARGAGLDRWRRFLTRKCPPSLCAIWAWCARCRKSGDVLEVALTPTYSGCPVTEMIEQSVVDGLQSAGLVARCRSSCNAPPPGPRTDHARRPRQAACLWHCAPGAVQAHEPITLRFMPREQYQQQRAGVAALYRPPALRQWATERLAAYGSTALQSPLSLHQLPRTLRILQADMSMKHFLNSCAVSSSLASREEDRCHRCEAALARHPCKAL